MKQRRLIPFFTIACLILTPFSLLRAQEERKPFLVPVRTDKGSVPMAFRLDNHQRYADVGYQEHNHPAIPAETRGEVFVPDSVTTPDGRRLQACWLTRGCFQGCSKITKVRMPRGIRTISDLAFQRCTSLREVTFSDSLEVIYPQAFTGCNAIRRIVLGSPNPPRTYGTDTFDESIYGTATIVVPTGSADKYGKDYTFSRFRYRMELIPTYPRSSHE